MLTLNTQIPTSYRGAVRALVKAHGSWQAFITSKGKLSAQALNSDLIEFALKYPDLTARIEALLSASVAPYDPALDNDAADDMGAPDWARQDTVLVQIGGNTSSKALGDAMVAAGAITQAARTAVDMTIDAAVNNAAADKDTWLAGPSGTGMISGDFTYAFDKLAASVDQFLSPLVRSELSKAFGPVIDAANRGPVEVERIVEIERIVEVAPGEGPRVAALPKARRDKKVTFRTLYPSRNQKDAWYNSPLTLWAGAVTPAVDPFYVVVHFQMAALMTLIERGGNTWLAGPSGTGKSTMPAQAAAALGRPFVSIQMTRQTEVEALVGGMGLHKGNTVWEDGALTKAMRTPGCIILIDELTIAPAGVQAIIQHAASEARSITLPTGEVVRAADGVVFVVADNTCGSGDEGGLYQGTNVSNVALVTRFGRMLIIDYLTAQQEAEALANHTRCPMPAARHLVDIVHQARRLPALQGVVISLRQMVGFIQCVQDGFNSKDAFIMAISSRMSSVDKAAIDILVDLAWSQTFDALVTNSPVPATPSDSPAAKAFGTDF